MNTSAEQTQEAGKTVVAVLTALRYGETTTAHEVLEESAYPTVVAFALAAMVHGMLTKMGEITGDPTAVDKRLQEMALEVERFGLPQT